MRSAADSSAPCRRVRGAEAGRRSCRSSSRPRSGVRRGAIRYSCSRCRRRGGHRRAADGEASPMKVYQRALVLLIGLALVAPGLAGAPAADQPPLPRAPAGQGDSTAHRGTAEQMVRWEKELSNWGRWGPADQRGTLNLITPQKALAALRLVREGISVSLHRFPDYEKAIDAGNMNAETKRWMTHVDPQTGRVRSALDAVSF